MLHDHGFNKPIEHFNLQQKKVITTNTLYVGIDVSSKSNVIYLMLPMVISTVTFLLPTHMKVLHNW